MSLTSIKGYKQKKKIEKVLEDINNILKVYNLCISALKYYGKYGSVMEVISIMQNNKTLLEIQYNKYKKMLDKENES